MHPLALAPSTAFDVAGAALIVAAIVSQTKFILTFFIPATASFQNASVRLYVALVSLLTVAAIDWANYAINTRTDALGVVSTSLAVTAAAISGYHLLTSDGIPTIPLGTFTSLPPIHGQEPIPVESAAIGITEPATPPAA